MQSHVCACMHKCTHTHTISTLTIQCQMFSGVLKASCVCPLVSRCCPRKIFALGLVNNAEIWKSHRIRKWSVLEQIEFHIFQGCQIRGQDYTSAMSRGQNQPKKVGCFLCAFCMLSVCIPQDLPPALLHPRMAAWRQRPAWGPFFPLSFPASILYTTMRWTFLCVFEKRSSNFF